ncbi:hypothetical protein [Aegicerativicinus sediminis]|uniref:hypothetical protein n=1 Tax=Aegicerativicinus sediminis TaxID=2893202 RepID=UPI001E339600|nr:hypothetical protein [Aegicerativicinus sediminis]
MINFQNLSKNQKLALGVLFDAIGMVTFIDIIWAPASAYLMTKMYAGRKGRIGGILSFIEEILPGMDFIPSFTIMWLYTYVFSPQKKVQTIEVKS